MAPTHLSEGRPRRATTAVAELKLGETEAHFPLRFLLRFTRDLGRQGGRAPCGHEATDDGLL